MVRPTRFERVTAGTARIRAGFADIVYELIAKGLKAS